MEHVTIFCSRNDVAFGLQHSCFQSIQSVFRSSNEMTYGACCMWR